MKRYSQRKTIRSRIVRSLAKTTPGGRGRISKRRSYKVHVGVAKRKVSRSTRSFSPLMVPR